MFYNSYISLNNPIGNAHLPTLLTDYLKCWKAHCTASRDMSSSFCSIVTQLPVCRPVTLPLGISKSWKLAKMSCFLTLPPTDARVFLQTHPSPSFPVLFLSPNLLSDFWAKVIWKYPIEITSSLLVEQMLLDSMKSRLCPEDVDPSVSPQISLAKKLLVSPPHQARSTDLLCFLQNIKLNCWGSNRDAWEETNACIGKQGAKWAAGEETFWSPLSSKGHWASWHGSWHDDFALLMNMLCSDKIVGGKPCGSIHQGAVFHAVQPKVIPETSTSS